jgi:hypothetical protein
MDLRHAHSCHCVQDGQGVVIQGARVGEFERRAILGPGHMSGWTTQTGP